MKLLGTAATSVCILALALTPSVANAGMEHSHQDAMWLKTSMQTDLAEIQAGRLAEIKSTNQDVMKLAQTLVTDHTKALTATKNLARRYGVAIPNSPSHLQMRAGQRLKKLSGRAFNVSFSDSQVSGHTIAIKQTRREAKLGSSPAIKGAARSSIGMLEMHLRLAEAALKASHVIYPKQ